MTCDNRMPLTEIIQNFLSDRDWKDKIHISNDATESTVATKMILADGQPYNLFIETREKLQDIAIFLYSPYSVTPSRISEVSRLLNIINIGVRIGRFACLDDGDNNAVQFCVRFDFEGSACTARQLDVMLDSAASVFGKYGPAIATVALTRTTAKDAFATLISEGDESAPDAPAPEHSCSTLPNSSN